MNEWDVDISEQAKRDLRGIYEYIAFGLSQPGIAEDMMKRLADAINGLDIMPERFPVYQREPWKSRGMRRMNVKNYAVFYIPIEAQNIVAIVQVVYGGRDIDEVLKSTDFTNAD